MDLNSDLESQSPSGYLRCTKLVELFETSVFAVADHILGGSFVASKNKFRG